MGKVIKDDYFLGLDIGTESVGYAVTNDEYKVLKFNGKSMWGSRLFDEASTAEDRRVFRCNSRRVKRRRWRLELLQDLFAEEISKVDMGFYQRLNESALFKEDKNFDEKYSLFNDNGYTDAQFYKEFKTIYHLRKALLEGDREFDVRLVYLAIHHILKNRGHFLFAGSIENATSFDTAFENFKECLNEELNIELLCNDMKELEEVIKNKSLTKKDKNNKILTLLNCSKSDKQLKAIIGLISGSKVKLVDVFNDDKLNDIEKPSISFEEGSYDELRMILEDDLQDRCNTLDVIKSIYDWAILADILKCDNNEKKIFLSSAKVRVFDEHKEDLALLKKVIKAYDKDVYVKFFKKYEKYNYCSYVGFMEKNNKKKALKKCSQDDFYKNVSSIIKKIKEVNGENDDIYKIEERLASNSFMPLQVTKSNGVIPYQVNYMELKEILEHAKKYLTFLSDKDNDGISVSDKILSLLEFKIPYYVGPINTYHGRNAWMVRKEEGKITPWNFDKKVDIDESANLFIRRMTNKCTYLVGKDVLPKYSLIYSEYEVWNEINNIKVKGEYLPIDLKYDLFEKIFKNNKRVTAKMVSDFLKAEGYRFEKDELTGFDKDFKSSLKAYIEMGNIFEREINTFEDIEMVENLILYISLYRADIPMLKRVIRKNYDKTKINDNKLKKLVKLKYDGWGAFSREFLMKVEGIDTQTGECFTIIQALRKTNENLMQLLSQRYTFMSEIDKINNNVKIEINEISYDSIVKDLYISPKIKRAVWQVIQIAEEIKKIMGKEPKKIFIEVAREHQDSNRTESRKTQLMELYSKCKDEERDWKAELETKTDSDFRSIKLYLYYTQMGRCMYSGDPIALSELSDTTIYDRDHIYPQSLTKDDSLDNLVLVKKTINATKNNDVISINVQNKMKNFWKELRRKGFISEEKYNRLMRKTPLTDEELAKFINRQLVETRQSTKVVANLFKSLYKDSEVVYVKAKSVSDFRHKTLDAVKVRSLNDLHHAKDAYLNIVVGNVYHEKFTSNPLMWLKNNRHKTNYSLNQMFNFDLVKGDKIIWKKGNKGTIESVKNQFRKNDIQYTRYATTNKGQLFNLQIVGADQNATVPIKKGMDVNKYGGYKSLTPAYFSLVESIGKKGEKIRSIEAIPLHKVKELELDRNKYEEYLAEAYNLKNPKVLLPKIKKDSLIVVNKFPMNLRGSTGAQLILQCAVQLCIPDNEQTYFKKIEKYINRNTERVDKKRLLEISDAEGITCEENLKIYDLFLEKQKETIYKYRPGSQVKKLEDGRKIFMKLSLEEQCITLNEILNLMRCKPITANLKSIDGAVSAGKIQINKIITNNESVKIINQSITGLFKQEVDLLKI
ncbi:type II CRISPR RNA-guided endonuclease Cas9 [Clostridium sp.]|uniref:type II CRISPR RNA-guided endonuclease Cas9 n=1 Tax=Clostridium sp. TaxID=1506 RepID=UPI00290AF762|nr:type II CRISPR RNA-guided endonuclease Cas9 [Clostridium sp.]MDU5106304.1 type II CRISPR RNA-guided endonuclease Cas9 [Clostridium sp.]